MNMVLKKQFTNRGKRGGVPEFLSPGGAPRSAELTGRRRGFTLVEVIVVLVILAILAAIAIPALTGYIDKSEVAQYKAMGRTQLTAMQTFVNLAIGEGGIAKLTAAPKKMFSENYPYSSDGRVIGGDFTAYGKAEYEALTGDTESFLDVGEHRWLHIYLTNDGAIKAYRYTATGYFGTGITLSIVWVKDMSSADLVTQKFLTDFSPSYPSMTNGFNIYSKKDKLN
ncbi:MAG: prepilin-type N-terminal cleavage/methylation domain-containing protein [Clostridiales Family XIII bacterium]|jgi:prepilin-type N-terminal cleavage/methylation domain-containing protein|nr:prepilin-type N-terminal cleavage/methylation domain-containing protein [Clostridiales Family XIII bacterium]